jgi:hypothetical protein
LFGLVLLLLTISWWRTTKPEPPSLGPLEVMGDRKWAAAPEHERRRMLEEFRPVGAEPMNVYVEPDPVDLTVLAREAPPSFDDLRDQPEDPEALEIDSKPSTPVVDPDEPGVEADEAGVDPDVEVGADAGDVKADAEAPVDAASVAAEPDAVASAGADRAGAEVDGTLAMPVPAFDAAVAAVDDVELEGRATIDDPVSPNAGG